METMLQAITTVGFPIAACIAMGYYVKYTNDSNERRFQNECDSHKEEMSKITEAVNNNTIALTKLMEKMEG